MGQGTIKINQNAVYGSFITLIFSGYDSRKYGRFLEVYKILQQRIKVQGKNKKGNASCEMYEYTLMVYDIERMVDRNGKSGWIDDKLLDKDAISQ